MSLDGLRQAYETGDKVQGGIAGINLTASTLHATDSILTAAGRTAPLLRQASRFVPLVSTGTTFVDGTYRILKEDTAQHMGERAAAVTTTTAAGYLLGGAAATTAETGALTSLIGGGGAVVTAAAAPVVLAAVGAGAIAYTGDKVIEAKRGWDKLDREIADDAKPGKVKWAKDGEAPSIRHYKHIAVGMLDVSPDLKQENMNGAIPRDQNGRMTMKDIDKVDMRDPKNIAELDRALQREIVKQDAIMKANGSALPKWMRGDSASTYTLAQIKQAPLVAARQELEEYRKALDAWNVAQPSSADKPAAKSKPVTPAV
jgi:hypothetical protein